MQHGFCVGLVFGLTEYPSACPDDGVRRYDKRIRKVFRDLFSLCPRQSLYRFVRACAARRYLLALCRNDGEIKPQRFKQLLSPR